MLSSVFFDCDSTLVSIEGVDALAEKLADKNSREQILKLTEKAMNGELPFSEVYKKRLEIIRPSKKDLESLGDLYISSLVSGATELIQNLQKKSIEVGIVSGGFELSIFKLADFFGVQRKNVFSVPVYFQPNGEYKDFDQKNPLVQNGGKPEVLKKLGQQFRPLLFVGDGVTDLETQKNGADFFVGFGGVVKRATVKGKSQLWFEKNLDSFYEFLKIEKLVT